ncbi:MAG: zinc ribbon domain-containing protein, partial [Desulfobacteraceae bacterium]
MEIQSNSDVFKAYYKMEAEYNYSYGRISKFFRELMENRRIMGSQCRKCGVVFCPPTSDCPKCWTPTEWIEVG